LRRATGHRADDSPETARRISAQRVPARSRHARHGGGPAGAEGRHHPPAPVRRAAGRRDRLRRRRGRARELTTDPLDYLFSLERLGMKFGLENISRLCAALSHPERAFRSVLIAGTNGKGSVTAMIHRGLLETGLLAARYTSPHLERIEERYVIGSNEVETARL